MRRKTLAGVLAVMALAIPVSSAAAFGGPNSAGNSGHFHPGSNPCQSSNDQPNCPGPH
jgi:hypothetical protein